jgi:hypothetical protein
MRSPLPLHATALALISATATAGEFDRPAPPLAQLLAQARAAKKPVLLDFSTVW